MLTPAKAYARATTIVQQAIPEVQVGNDRRRAAYLIARAALLDVIAADGPQSASEMAYSLGDELATERAR